MIPVSATFGSVAVPSDPVTALPTLLPLRVKSIVFPERPVPLAVSVAERSAVPPSVPDAEATASDVTTLSSKQT